MTPEINAAQVLKERCGWGSPGLAIRTGLERTPAGHLNSANPAPMLFGKPTSSSSRCPKPTAW